MCYQNGKKILPPPLLSAIQEYIDGEYIYIPRKTNNKRPWGSTKGTKQQTAERNQWKPEKRRRVCRIPT